MKDIISQELEWLRTEAYQPGSTPQEVEEWVLMTPP